MHVCSQKRGKEVHFWPEDFILSLRQADNNTVCMKQSALAIAAEQHIRYTFSIQFSENHMNIALL